MRRVELKRVSNSPFKKGHKLGFQKGHTGYGMERRREKHMFQRALELELEKLRNTKDFDDEGKRIDVKKKRIARVADALVTAAENGDVPAINAIANRVDGMPTQTIEQNTNLNARVLAAQVTTKITPASAARLYQEQIKAPDDNDDV